MRPFSLTRGRALKGLIVVGAVLAAMPLVRAFPREVNITYRFGSDHPRVRALRLVYALEEDPEQPVQGASFQYPEGAPSAVHHRVRLGPGHYAIVAHVHEPSSIRRLRRSLRVPTEGDVYIDLQTLAKDRIVASSEHLKARTNW